MSILSLQNVFESCGEQLAWRMGKDLGELVCITLKKYVFLGMSMVYDALTRNSKLRRSNASLHTTSKVPVSCAQLWLAKAQSTDLTPACVCCSRLSLVRQYYQATYARSFHVSHTYVIGVVILQLLLVQGTAFFIGKKQRLEDHQFAINPSLLMIGSAYTSFLHRRAAMLMILSAAF